MKKLTTLSLLVAIIILSSLALTACSTPDQYVPAIRWEDGESYTYNVSLLNEDEAKRKVTHLDTVFYANHQLVDFATLDEYRPSSTTGTYTTTINAVGDNWQYTTSLAITNTYTSDHESFTTINNFVNAMTAEEKSSVLVKSSASSVQLMHSEECSVIFTNTLHQTPVSSTKELKTYYLGQRQQVVTTLSTDISYADNVATVDKTINSVPTTTKTKLSGNYIDVNQIALYARAIDKENAFETSPSINVFDGYSDSLTLVSFALSRDYHHLLDNLEGKYATVHTMTANSATSGTVQALYCNTKDTLSTKYGDLNMYTAVKLQSGMYVYELADYTEELTQQLQFAQSAE